MGLKPIARKRPLYFAKHLGFSRLFSRSAPEIGHGWTGLDRHHPLVAGRSKPVVRWPHGWMCCAASIPKRMRGARSERMVVRAKRWSRWCAWLWEGFGVVWKHQSTLCSKQVDNASLYDYFSSTNRWLSLQGVHLPVQSAGSRVQALTRLSAFKPAPTRRETTPEERWTKKNAGSSGMP